MPEKLTRTFPGPSVDAQRAGDSWLYGQAFLLDGERYRVTHYYVHGDTEPSVTVTLELWPDATT